MTQTDAQSACRDFHSPVKVAKDEDKVKVLGCYVLDAEAGHGWMEIHPVTKISVAQ